MKQWMLMALVGALFMLTGCPLQTEEPIDDGSYTTTDWLTGKWNEVGANNTIVNTHIVKQGKEPGHLQVYTVGEDGKTGNGYRAVILSKIGDRIFLNAYEPGDEESDPGYYIYRLDRRGTDAVDLVPVKSNALSSKTKGPALKEWLTLYAGRLIYKVDEQVHYRKG